MNIRNIGTVISREVRMGPRTMMLFWVVAFPLLITLVLRLVFGGFIDPQPKLGIADLGTSSITAAAVELEDVEVTLFDSVEDLQSRVESGGIDAGLILEPGFDAAVRSGEKPELKFFVGGESLASTRIVLAVSAIDLIRGLTGEPAPVEVIKEVIGNAPQVPIIDRLVPMLVLLAVSFGGIFVPAASIIQEKVQKTADAVLSTPLGVGEYLTAKGMVGFVLSVLVGLITLIVNGGWSSFMAGNLAASCVGALMSVVIGLIFGSLIGNIQSLFTVWKSAGIIFFAPAILFLFPGVPKWIEMLFPTYYFLGPLYDMTVNGLAFADVYVELLLGIAVSIALGFAVAPFARRMERRLAAN